jgi:hypothetical protein
MITDNKKSSIPVASTSNSYRIKKHRPAGVLVVNSSVTFMI